MVDCKIKIKRTKCASRQSEIEQLAISNVGQSFETTRTVERDEAVEVVVDVFAQRNLVARQLLTTNDRPTRVSIEIERNDENE